MILAGLVSAILTAVTHLSASIVTAPAPVSADLGVSPVKAPSCHAVALKGALGYIHPRESVSWLWADLSARHAWGLAYTYDRTIALDPRIPCQLVPAVAFHEWAHQKTHDYFGSWDKAVVTVPGGAPALEVLADCVSARMVADTTKTPPYLPYSEAAGGCSASTLKLATRVMEGS